MLSLKDSQCFGEICTGVSLLSPPIGRAYWVIMDVD